MLEYSIIGKNHAKLDAQNTTKYPHPFEEAESNQFYIKQ